MPNKSRFHQHCLQLLSERISELEGLIAAINTSKQNETKSSAGDKYETGRAMMQLEEDKINAQLALAQQSYRQLAQIASGQNSEQVQLGSMVQTQQRRYFLSVGLGKVAWDGQDYFCISPAAPVGKLLMGKRAGDTLLFNGQQDEIVEVQ